MSGPLKLKIKLKQRPQETDSASGRSEHKRKLEEYLPQQSGVACSDVNGNHSEVKRPKKQKHNQAAQAQPTASSHKVKLHIKGPWNKAATASETKSSPLRQFPSGSAQQLHPQAKPSSHGPSISAKHRPPAKAVQVLSQADTGPRLANKTHKLKGSGQANQQQGSQLADGATASHSRDGAASRGTSGVAHLEAASGPAEGSQLQLSSGKGLEALIVPTRAILERIVDKMQRKDNFNIFRDPVTEAVVRAGVSAAW